MSKPTPPHWKTIRVPFAMVAKGYGEARHIPGLTGRWDIIRASGAGPDEKPAAEGFVYLIVAPARVAP